MVAGVISKCGAWMGEVTGPTPWNKRGQFENVFIRDHLTKPFLKRIGCDPMGQSVLPEFNGYVYDPSRWRLKVLNAIMEQGYKPGDRWAFKGAKACLIWQVWADAFPLASWVIVRRDDERIVDSCIRAPFMRKRRTRDEWREWVERHKEFFGQITAACNNVWEIWPDDAIKDDSLDGLQALVHGLGLTWNGEAVRKFIDPSLWSG